MILKLLAVAVLLILAAAVVWALDLALTAMLNRLGIPDDIKKALRAVLAVLIFVLIALAVLGWLGVLPAGWW